MKLIHFVTKVLPGIRASLKNPNDLTTIKKKALALIGDQPLVDEEGNEVEIESIVLVPVGPGTPDDEKAGDEEDIETEEMEDEEETEETDEDEVVTEEGETEEPKPKEDEEEAAKRTARTSAFQFRRDLKSMRRTLLKEVRKINAKAARATGGNLRVDQKRTLGFKNMSEQLRCIATAAISGGSVDKRLTAVQTKATGLSEGISADGGFLLAPEFSDRIMEIVHEEENLLDQTDSIDIASSSIKIPAIDETSRATGSRRGGVRAYWLAEAGTLTASKPKLRQMTLTPHKLGVLAYVTEELLEDGGAALEQIVSRASAEEINFAVGDAIVNGTGAGQPLGILNSNCLVSVAKETGQAAATVVPENLVKMYSRLHASARSNSVWLVNQDVEPSLNLLALAIGTGGQAVYMPPGGLSQAPYGTILGRPVVPTEFNATLGTVGDILIADLAQYITVTRGAIKSAVSIHVQFLTDELCYKFTFRVDGQPWWNSALTPFKGSANTLSPFVALATRS